MLKSRIIFMSFLFLLLAGVNSNARASVAANEKIENSMGVNIPMQHILQIYNGMDKSADDYDLANFNC